MINLETFLIGLMAVSALTTLTTEGVKKILTEHSVKCHANTLAAIVATILSAAVGVGYAIVTDAGFTARVIVCIVAMVFMSWLCAMVGYDKVIGQFKSKNKEE